MDNTLFQNLIALLSAGFGAAFSLGFAVSHRQLCALISFAAGTLMAAALFHIVPEALHDLPLFPVATALGSGYLVFHLLSRYVTHVCPACSASHFDEQSSQKFKSLVTLLTIGLSIHSAMDGMAIALGRHMGEHTDHSVFLTITIHKFPEGLALCALLLKAGYDRFKAFWMTLIYESTTLVGWVAGSTLMQNPPHGEWLDLALLHVAGGFVYLALHAVLNEAREHSPRLVVAFFLAGLGLIGSLSFLLH